ncbi:MAG TPA: serine/threonine-protein kinase [Bryobacteraceae bacterium]|nr:serine/threonine-protein kinase [Bryobacteraceae bacterium]
MVGRTVAHYKLTDKLGSGGMGEIYRALDTRLSRIVAIKVLPESYVGDAERRRRFLQEGRAASALNHPNIVTIHDVVFEDDTAFLVMEFISGKTLAELMAEGRMPVFDVLKYATQMADALATAHDAGIIHRDLKPGNVMVTDRGLVKILDFGLAKRLAFANSPVALGDSATTAVVAPPTVEGSILGTVYYMSPEQAEGKIVDARSDIFSFGVMLYEMLTGNRPFAGDSTLSILSSILRDEAKPISVELPSLPRPIDELVRRCIAKRPDARWQSMHELRDALNALSNDSQAQTLVVPPAPARRASLFAAGVGATSLVAVVVGWWALGHLKDKPAPRLVGATVSAPLSHPSPPNGDALTDEGVIAMLRAKVPAQVILQQIRVSSTRFDLSVPAIIRLTEAGASFELIETMRNPRSAPRSGKTRPESPLAPAPAMPPFSARVTSADVARPALPAPVGATVPVVVPDALPVEIELAEDVPEDAKSGRPLHFTLKNEIRIGQTVVAAIHAPVVGEIVDEARKKLIGGTKLTFRLKSLSAAGGAMLLLRTTPTDRDGRRPVESTSMPKPPKGIAAVIGTEYIAYTAGQQTVNLPQSSGRSVR